ncbi:hypothetical protein, partial [Hornefia butyriciproducens]|uniref:hypothetical protein n=1 Tax=Hornefia butyriciproducens TaxID=2652293 RepID=UPI003F888523
MLQPALKADDGVKFLKVSETVPEQASQMIQVIQRGPVIRSSFHAFRRFRAALSSFFYSGNRPGKVFLALNIPLSGNH